jgi:hypothetical protein
MLPTTTAGAWALAEYIASDESFGGADAPERYKATFLRVIAWLTGNPVPAPEGGGEDDAPESYEPSPDADPYRPDGTRCGCALTGLIGRSRGRH